jgi:hypothetical protein
VPDLSAYDTRFFAREPSMLALPVADTEDHEQLLEQARTVLLHMQAIGYAARDIADDADDEEGDGAGRDREMSEAAAASRLLLRADGSLAVQIALPVDANADADADAEVDEGEDEDVGGAESEDGSNANAAAASEQRVELNFDREIERARVEWAEQQRRIFAPVASSSSSAPASAAAPASKPESGAAADTPVAPATAESKDGYEGDNVNLLVNNGGSRPMRPMRSRVGAATTRNDGAKK